MSGILFGVGVGPGDPELMTLKAVRILNSVRIVVYPAPPEGESMARSIAAAHLHPGIEEIPLRISFDPARRADDAYDAGAEAIARHLGEGRDVAALCEGDPLFFGSFLYLLARLDGRFPIQVVPGVSSMMACAALLGHPLTARDDSLVVIPAPRPEADIERLLSGSDAAAIMKLGRHLPKVWRVLKRLELTDRALYIERAGLPGQRIRPLAEAAQDPAPPYFAMILVHRRGKAWN